MQKRPNAATFKGKSLTVAGQPLRPGDNAPDFACVTAGLEVIGLAQTPHQVRLFNVVPSLDTTICSLQTRRFEETLASLGDRVACYTFSLDTPFAQKRFCTDANLSRMQTLSDTYDYSFGQNYGVLIVEGLPIKLLQRAVFVVDRHGKITHAEYVPEVASHPNYDNALAAIQGLVG